MPSATLNASVAGPIALAVSAALTYEGASPGLRLRLTGAQTYVVDLAMIPSAGLRGLLVILDPLDADGSPVTAPITLTWTSNSVSKSQELSAGTAPQVPGFFALASPDPTHGITALSIVTTANAVVHVTAFG